MVPTARGFDTYYGYLNGEEDYYTHTREGGYDMRDQDSVAWAANGSYSTDLFVDHALHILSNYSSRSAGEHTPFFLYLAFQTMHSPIEAPQWAIDRFNKTIADENRRTVAGMVTVLDLAIANITAALKAGGLDENTIIVFSTDVRPCRGRVL